MIPTLDTVLPDGFAEDCLILSTTSLLLLGQDSVATHNRKRTVQGGFSAHKGEPVIGGSWGGHY